MQEGSGASVDSKWQTQKLQDRKTFCEVCGNCVLFKKAYWERQNRDTQLSISVVSWKFCHKHTRLNTCLPLCKTKQKRNKTTTNKIHALRHRQLSGFQCVPPQYDCIVSPCPTQVPLQCLPLLGQFYKDPWFCLLSAQNFSNKISPVACLCSSWDHSAVCWTAFLMSFKDQTRFWI